MLPLPALPVLIFWTRNAALDADWYPDIQFSRRFHASASCADRS